MENILPQRRRSYHQRPSEATGPCSVRHCIGDQHSLPQHKKTTRLGIIAIGSPLQNEGPVATGTVLLQPDNCAVFIPILPHFYSNVAPLVKGKMPNFTPFLPYRQFLPFQAFCPKFTQLSVLCTLRLPRFYPGGEMTLSLLVLKPLQVMHLDAYLYI